MSYKVIINGDGENFWVSFDDDNFLGALDRFEAEQQPARKVTLEWEHFDWEEE